MIVMMSENKEGSEGECVNSLYSEQRPIFYDRFNAHKKRSAEALLE